MAKATATCTCCECGKSFTASRILATRAQSEDRVHRIGQEKNVHYIDICASNKLDERIIACLSRKENLVEHFRREIHKRRELKGGIENASNRIILKGKAKNRI